LWISSPCVKRESSIHWRMVGKRVAVRGIPEGRAGSGRRL